MRMQGNGEWDESWQWHGQGPYGATGRYFPHGLPSPEADFYTDMAHQNRLPPGGAGRQTFGGPYHQTPDYNAVESMFQQRGISYEQTQLSTSRGQYQAFSFNQGDRQSYLFQEPVTGAWMANSQRNIESAYAILPSASWSATGGIDLRSVGQNIQSALEYQGSFGSAMSSMQMPNVRMLGLEANSVMRSQIGSGMQINADYDQRNSLIDSLNAQYGMNLVARQSGFAYDLGAVFSSAFPTDAMGMSAVTDEKMKRLQLSLRQPGYIYKGGVEQGMGPEGFWNRGASMPNQSTLLNEMFLSFAPHIPEGTAFGSNQLSVGMPYNTTLQGQFNLQPGQVFGQGGSQSIHDLEQMLGRQFGNYSSINIQNATYDGGQTQVEMRMLTHLISAKGPTGKALLTGVDDDRMPTMQTPFGSTRADIVRPWDPAHTGMIAESMFKALPAGQRRDQWQIYAMQTMENPADVRAALRGWSGSGAIPNQYAAPARDMMIQWAMQNRQQNVTLQNTVVSGSAYYTMLQNNQGMFDPGSVRAMSGNRYMIPSMTVPALVGQTAEQLSPEWSGNRTLIRPDSLRMIHDAQPDVYNAIMSTYGPNRQAHETVMSFMARTDPGVRERLAATTGLQAADPGMLSNLRAGLYAANPNLSPGQLDRSTLEAYGAARPGAIQLPGGGILPSGGTLAGMGVYDDETQQELINNLASSGLSAIMGEEGGEAKAMSHLATLANSRSTIEGAFGREVPGGTNFLFANSAVPENSVVADWKTIDRMYNGTKSRDELRQMHERGQLTTGTLRFPHADAGRPVQAIQSLLPFEELSQEDQRLIGAPKGRMFTSEAGAFAMQGDSDADRMVGIATAGISPSDPHALKRYYDNVVGSESVKRAQRLAGEMNTSGFMAEARGANRFMSADAIRNQYIEQERIAKGNIGQGYSFFQRGLSPILSDINRRLGRSTSVSGLISDTAGTLGMNLTQSALDRGADQDPSLGNLMRMARGKRYGSDYGIWNHQKGELENLMGGATGHYDANMASMDILRQYSSIGKDVYANDPAQWREQFGSKIATLLSPVDDLGNADRQSQIMAAMEVVQQGGNVDPMAFTGGRDFSEYGVGGTPGNMSPAMEHYAAIFESAKGVTPLPGLTAHAQAGGMARNIRAFQRHGTSTSLEGFMGIDHPVVAAGRASMGAGASASERAARYADLQSRTTTRGYIPTREERDFMRQQYDDADMSNAAFGGGASGGGGGGGIVSGGDTGLPFDGGSGGGGRGGGGGWGGRRETHTSRLSLFQMESNVEFLQKFREEAEKLAEILPKATVAEREHIDNLKSIVKAADQVEKVGSGLSGRSPASMNPNELNALRAYRSMSGMDETLDTLREQKLRTGRGELGADPYEDYTPSILSALNAGGKSGAKLRASVFGEGGPHSEFGAFFGERGINALSGISQTASNAFSPESLWRIRNVNAMFIKPGMNAMEGYMNQMAQQDMMMMQTGQGSYDELMSGTYGRMQRRQIGGEEAGLRFGEQVYNAYGFAADLGLKREAMNTPLGAIAGVGGPALGASIIGSTLAGPVGAVIAGGATAAVGTAGYTQAAMQNYRSIAEFQSTNRGAGDILRNFEGAVGMTGNRIGYDLGLVSQEQYDRMNNSGQFYDAMRTYASGITTRQQMVDRSKSMGFNPADAISGAQEMFIGDMTQQGVSRSQSLDLLGYYQTYNPNRMPSGPQFRNTIALTAQGMNLPGMATSIAGAYGVSPTDQAGMDAINQQVIGIGMGMPQGTNFGLFSQSVMNQANELQGVNEARYGAGRPGRGIDLTMTNPFMRSAIFGFDQQLSNVAQNAPGFYSNVMQGLEGTIEGEMRSGSMSRANRIRSQGMSMQGLYQQGLAAGTPDLGMMLQYASQLEEGDYSQVMAVTSGDRYAWSRMGARTGNLAHQTVDVNTGLSPTYRSISPEWHSRLQQTQAGLYGLSASEAALGERGLQDQIRVMGRDLNTYQFQQQQYGRAISYQSMTGGGRVGEGGWATGGDNLASLGAVFNANGMQFNAGNGMGMWQIQDAQERIQRERQQWGLQQQGVSLGFQGQNMALNAQQFNERWNMNWNQQQAGFAFQAWNMNFSRQNQVTQQGWQQEDMAMDQNRSDLQFGWQMEDFDRNIRFSRGRQRMDLMRQQERSVVMHGLDETQRDRREDRFEQEKKWATELYEANKKYFEETKKMSQDEMLMNKRHFEERQGLERTQFNLAKENFDKEVEWTKQQWKLEDQRRLVDRQVQTLQNNMQDALAHKTRETEVFTNRYRDALDGVQREFQENNAAINAAVQNLGALRAALQSLATISISGSSSSSGSGTHPGRLMPSSTSSGLGTERNTQLLEQMVNIMKNGLINATIYTNDNQVKTGDLYQSAMRMVQ